MGRYEEQQNTTTGTLTGAPAQQNTTPRLTSIDTYMANSNTSTNNQRATSNTNADAILNHIVTSRLLAAMKGKNIPIDLTGMPTDDLDKNLDPETVRTLLRQSLKDRHIAVVKGDKTNELYPGLGLALDPRYAQRSQKEADYRINDQHKPVSMTWLPKHYLDPLTEPANPPAAAPKPKAQNIPPVTQTRQPSGNTQDIHLEITPVNPPANQKSGPANPPGINPNNRPRTNSTPAQPAPKAITNPSVPKAATNPKQSIQPMKAGGGLDPAALKNNNAHLLGGIGYLNRRYKVVPEKTRLGFCQRWTRYACESQGLHIPQGGYAVQAGRALLKDPGKYGWKQVDPNTLPPGTPYLAYFDHCGVKRDKNNRFVRYNGHAAIVYNGNLYADTALPITPKWRSNMIGAFIWVGK